MARREAPHIADEVLDQLLASTDAAAALQVVSRILRTLLVAVAGPVRRS